MLTGAWRFLTQGGQWINIASWSNCVTMHLGSGCGVGEAIAKRSNYPRSLDSVEEDSKWRNPEVTGGTGALGCGLDKGLGTASLESPWETPLSFLKGACLIEGARVKFYIIPRKPCTMIMQWPLHRQRLSVLAGRTRTRWWGNPFLILKVVSQWASQVAIVVKNPPANAGDTRDACSIPGSGRSPRGGHGNPLQYSCLENPMDREAWRAAVHRQRAGHDWRNLVPMQSPLITLSHPSSLSP